MIRLLLVEDSDLDAELVSATLADERLDCRITRVVNEAGFRAALAEQEPDIVLSDFRLPTFDGMSALRIARAHYGDLPFIFVSGAFGEELAVQCLKAGATDYVLKQRIERLPTAVRLALAETQARRERRAAEQERRQLEEERAQLLAAERTLRREAELANRAKDDFLATLSHELRTPLNAILGWARMLGSGRLDDAATRQAIDVIQRNAKLQAKLIEDILDVSRIISGKLRLESEPVDVKSVVLAAVEAIRPACDAKSLTLDADAIRNAELDIVTGDAMRLQQIFGNLLSNAVKFTPKGGTIRVEALRIDGIVTVSVSDTGTGINHDFLPHIFERFRQRDGSTRRMHGGLGLGLAIAQHLAQLHGGTIQADSAGEGAGSTFRVTLPIASLKHAPNESTHLRDAWKPPSAALQDLKGTRILVVDDEPDSRELIVEVLTRCGADVRSADTVAEAMRKFERERPDVIVSDICMPGEDGFTLIGRIRARDATSARRTPVIALTAYAGEDQRRRVLAAGFSRHIEKPYNPTDIAAAVGELASSQGASHP
ncbi:MAG: response regulator [Tepidisphaeraceae bacterium]